MQETIIQEKSSTENIKEVAEIKNSSKKELEQLNLDIFYKIENNEVSYNLDSVAQYLQICDIGNFDKYYGTSILAMQIFLEASGFDIGKIDGIRGPKFIQGIKEFQRNHNLPQTGKVDTTTLSSIVNICDTTIDSGIKLIHHLPPQTPPETSIRIVPRIEYDPEGFRNLRDSEFSQWFEKDNFKQCGVGDCRLLAGMDSLIHYGDYKKLIMNSVRINDQGDFKILIPLTLQKDKKGYSDFLKKDHSKKKILTIKKKEYTELWHQAGINGREINLADTQQIGLRAFLLAYSKYSTDQQDVDNVRMNGGWASYFFRDTIDNANVYFNQKNWINKSNFLGQLDYIVKNFSPQTDLLCISVSQGNALQERNHEQDYHEISVEKTYYNSQDHQWYIRVSNPWRGNYSRDVPFSKLQEYCLGFNIASRNKNKYNNLPTRHTSGHAENHRGGEHGQASLTTIIENYGSKDEGLRDNRGTIHLLPKGYGDFELQSRGNTLKFQNTTDSLIFSGNPPLTIPKNSLSSFIPEIARTYNQNVSIDTIRICLYGAKIANFINRMFHDYILTKKGAKTTPFFVNSDNELIFDDKNTSILDEVRDFYKGGVRVLEDWTQLGLQYNDTKTQKDLANYLNGLYKNFLQQNK